MTIRPAWDWSIAWHRISRGAPMASASRSIDATHRRIQSRDDRSGCYTTGQRGDRARTLRSRSDERDGVAIAAVHRGLGHDARAVFREGGLASDANLDVRRCSWNLDL